MEYFSYHDGKFHVERIAIATLAEIIETPFYLYSAASLKENFTSFQTALQRVFPSRPPLIAYAVKANSNQAVLRLLAREGAGADVVSQGELRRALRAGMTPQQIVFSGVGKTVNEIDFALAQGILCFNVESVPELHLLNARAQKLGINAPVSLRINPNIDAGSHAKITTGRAEDKFGIAFREIAQMPNLEVKGIDIHIGSQICDLAPFDKAFAAIAELLRILRNDGHDIRHIDVGGGLGIDYFDGETPLPIDAYAQIIGHHFSSMDIDIICEPGRLIVGNAGVLITRVLYLKQTETKNFIIVDAAMNDLIRPTLYEAQHKIIPVRLPISETDLIHADIVGPVCESGDYLAQNVKLTTPQSNDLLAVLSAGAYGAVMSNSYNTRPLVPEILVMGNQFDIIRRRPSFEEMLTLEQVPDWLA